MEKRKPWQFYLILIVVILTLYNILPTILYYSNPLYQPVTESRAEKVAVSISNRVNGLKDQSTAWLQSFSHLIGVKPESIDILPDRPRLIQLTFKNDADAATFRKFLPAAGKHIPFVPAQLELQVGAEDLSANKVLVARQIGVNLDPAQVDQFFGYISKYNENNQISPEYRKLVYDRVAEIAMTVAGPSNNGLRVQAVVEGGPGTNIREVVDSLSREIVEVHKILGKNSPIVKRYFSTFTQINVSDRESLMQQFLVKLEAVNAGIKKEREALLQEMKKATEEGGFQTTTQEQQLSLLKSQSDNISEASAIIRSNIGEFSKGTPPLDREQIAKLLEKNNSKLESGDIIQRINLKGYNPFISGLMINWPDNRVVLNLYDDVQKIRTQPNVTEEEAYQRDQLAKTVINAIARISRASDETINPFGDGFAIALNTLTNPNSFLTFNLSTLAKKQSAQIEEQLFLHWVPEHTDLVREVYPIHDFDTFKTLSPTEQKLGLVIYAPAMYGETPPAGFKTDSIYVIARGLENISEKYRQNPESKDSQAYLNDIQKLYSLLTQNGFISYPGSSFGIDKAFKTDYIFELNDYYADLIKATREDFVVKGSKRKAVLDFTDVEQRILTLNKIEDLIQEDLVKWYEEYQAAQVDIYDTSRYLIPPPTKNVYWQNLMLSLRKYFRGDDRKIIRWGLDLSGGKTVRIGLRDLNNQIVTDPNDLNQAVNELYNRVNAMGVSERTIHIENNHVILEFPGSQAFSASELIKASRMTFHIVNEKFSSHASPLWEATNEFLQGVWNEAVVTNRKDVESINEIAWLHLGGDPETGGFTRQRSASAQLLFENGLRLAASNADISSAFNDTLSLIGRLRGDDFSEWEGQSHPLAIVFNNYALEGSSLTDIVAGYDPTEGNVLTFSVKRSYGGADRGLGSPREDLFAWTSQFAEDKIQGTSKEAFTKGKGWRMAVVLNGTIITHPQLRAALRDGGSISGRFSQREINKLVADLKAGSLSFTPKILSEQNVSPELGKEERQRGILAAVIALVLVVFAMVGYYRFAGVIASIAVLFNILMIWAVLVNLGAAITLPGLAGVVLTIGMAVDANVLVFERIREEFMISGRIASAIQAGYRKAFSAIVDSNVTTIIAALILLQFDSGPIKGFAVTLIIGIVSSMFTALFMTRYFFAGWVRNPKHKELKMSHWIGETKIDFLGKAKFAVIVSLVIALIGGYFFFEQRRSIFGMDFTGGYSINLNIAERSNDETSYRLQAFRALVDAGASTNDVQVRELSRPNQLRIQLGMGLEEPGRPFYGLPEQLQDAPSNYDYQKNPRIVWVVNTLEKAGLQIHKSQLRNLDNEWSVMSGQLSDNMRNNAIIALAIALFSILIYITIRFEFKYAVAAVLGLGYDVIISLAIFAMFHWIGFPVQIDLQVVGAIMTIIGYSLNDTIIVFDRIREDVHVLRKLKYEQVINHALNITMSRTLMTSGTTLLVLLSLDLLGGVSIFSFSLVMTIGVIVGTLSSLFVAAPILLFFHNRELEQHEYEVSAKKT